MSEPPGLVVSVADAKQALAAMRTTQADFEATKSGARPLESKRQSKRSATFKAKCIARAAATTAETFCRQALVTIYRRIRKPTWICISFCVRLRRRAAGAIARVRARAAVCERAARLCVSNAITRVCSCAAERDRVLQMLKEKPRKLPYDVGYDDATKQFSFSSVTGEISMAHPKPHPNATAEQPIPAYAKDGSIVEPLQPPKGSPFVLMPEERGGWCYYNSKYGDTQWHAPEGSGPLQTRTLPTGSSGWPPPYLCDSFTPMSQAMRREGRWKPIFRDRKEETLLLNLDTGAVRAAPWVCLRTEYGGIFFANLWTRETRWKPPHLWMEDWIERVSYPVSFSIRNPVELSCPYLAETSPLRRDMLPLMIGRMRVDGGAPYMYEATQGVPRYKPDEWDTPDTHPALIDLTPSVHGGA